MIPDWFRTPEERAAEEAARRTVAEAERRRREEGQDRERAEAAERRRALEDRLGIGDEARELWDRARELLQERGQMTACLLGSYLLPVVNGTATIATAVPFFAETIPRHAEAMRAAVEEVSGQQIAKVEVKLVEGASP